MKPILSILQPLRLLCALLFILTACSDSPKQSTDSSDSLKVSAEIQDTTWVEEDRPLHTEEPIVSDTLIDFSHQSFFTGYANLLWKCEFDYGCDCCAGHIVFYPNRSYMEVSQCMGDFSATRGKYSVEDSVLHLRSDSVVVAWIYEKGTEDTSNRKLVDTIMAPEISKYVIRKYCGKVKLILIIDPDQVAISAMATKFDDSLLEGRFREIDLRYKANK